MTKLASAFIVDDNSRDLEFLTIAFQSHGEVMVSGETSPAAAVGRIRNEKPDIVMLDIKMPDLDGCSVLSLLRGGGNPSPW